MVKEQLKQVLTGTDDDGRVVLCVALLATYYLRDGTRPPAQEAVRDVATRFCHTFGEQLRWAKLGEARFEEVKPADESWSDWRLPGADDTLGRWEFYLHGGQRADAASDCRLFGLGNNPLLPGWSFLSMAVPRDWYVTHDGSFPDLMAECCEQLTPVYAYGGIGLTESPRLGVAQQHEAEVCGLARRFPGLEVDYPTAHTTALKNAVRSPSWLSFLDADKVEQLGGTQQLKIRCGDAFEVRACAGGVLIRAGRFPLLGDTDRRLTVPLMEQLARVLKPLQVSQHPPFHFSHGGMNHEETRRWLHRFESPEPRP